MLTSIAIILLLGLLLGHIFNKMKLPSLLGMVIVGMLMSPYAFDLIDDSILNISADLRKIALVIILTRGGLSLDLAELKKVGRPAVLMCFVPACFEILGTILLGPKLLGLTVLESAILGSVIAAVSPAVIVPRMIRFIEEGKGKKHGVPQLILAGASVDDIFVIVAFTIFTSFAVKGTFSPVQFLQIPVSIILGVIVGGITGWILIKFFKAVHIRDSVKVMILLSLSFLLVELETKLENMVPFSGLLAIMSFAIVIKQKYDVLAVRLSSKYNKLWLMAEVLLFVLVGATVDLKYAWAEGMNAILLLVGALILRMLGVVVCLIKTKLTKKERVFCMLAYIPKATVQAAIGAVPLSMGLSCGNIVLTVAVLSILLTAPIGALFIDHSYKKLLDA